MLYDKKLCNKAIVDTIANRSLPALKVGFIPSADLLALGVAWAPLFFWLITHESLKNIKQLEYTKASHTLKPTHCEIKG